MLMFGHVHAANAQCIGGPNGTPQQPSYLLQNEFQAGQPNGAITSACMRDLIATTTLGNRITAVGAVASSTAPTCTTVATNTTITCSGSYNDFVAGNAITMQVNSSGSGPGPTSSLATPTISSVTPTTLDTTHYLPTAGCHVTASVGDITTGTNTLFVNNTRLYRAGDSITVAGAGVGAAALTTTVSAVTFNDIYAMQIELTANASTTVALAAVTGFNCTTTWRYQVVAVDVMGGKSAPSTLVQTTTGAMNLGPSNFNEISLSPVTNAVAYLLYACKGSGCTPTLTNIETPNGSHNPGGDPLLLAYSAAAAPTIIVFHDWNMPYVQDSYGGLAVPGAATKQQLSTTIVSGVGPTFVLAVAPSTSGTFTMRHDNGPAFSAALQAACTGNIAVSVTPGYYDIGTPIKTDGVSDCFSAPFVGPASGYTNSNGNHSTTNFNWIGPVGGTVMNLNGMSGAIVGGFVISAGENSLGGATPGIGIDWDQVSPASNSKQQFVGISITNAGIGLRECNLGLNCDTTTINQIQVGGLTGSGAGIGIYQNAIASLAVDVSDFDVGANISFFNAARAGNMNLSHGFCGMGPINSTTQTYGGICFWSVGYSYVAYLLQDVHTEYDVKQFYAAGNNFWGGFQCNDCRWNGMTDWDGFAYRLGQGQAVLHSTTAWVPGDLQGSNLPFFEVESPGTLTESGGIYGASPTIVAGGGNWIGLGSQQMTQIGGVWNTVGVDTQFWNVQLGFPAATTAALGGGALAAGACTSGTATVTGATTAMTAHASPVASPLADASHAVSIFAYVSSANTVTVDVCAVVATTPASRVYNVRVTQ
jgi:hypothetical protein